MSYNWGPHYIVPSEAMKKYSGGVMLREDYNEELLQKEMEELGLKGFISGISNPWYYRRKGTETWIKAGESKDVSQNFPVHWDTTTVENGQYEVLGMMHIFIRNDAGERAIARQNVVEITIDN